MARHVSMLPSMLVSKTLLQVNVVPTGHCHPISNHAQASFLLPGKYDVDEGTFLKHRWSKL